MRREPSPGRRARHVHGAHRRRAATRLRGAVPVHLAGVQRHWLAHFDDDELRALGRAARRGSTRRRSERPDAASRGRPRLARGRRRGRRVRLRVRRGLGRRRAVGAADLPAVAARVHRRHAVRGRRRGRRRRQRWPRRSAAGCCSARRNTLYAMRLAPLLRVRGLRRLLAALGTIDESTAMAVAQRDAGAARGSRSGGRSASVFVGLEPGHAARRGRAGALGRPDDVRPRRGRPGGLPRAARARGCAPARSSGGSPRRRGDRGALIPITPPGVPVLAASAALAVWLPRRSGSAGR